MNQLVGLLKSKNMTIASIESLTAGLFAAKVASVSGASTVLKGGMITYQTSAKQDVLHIDEQILKTYGVVSKECAEAMAICGEKIFKTDIIVSCTGNAGPDVMEEKPVGLVFMGIRIYGKIYTYQNVFRGSRNEIREQVCTYLENKLIEHLS
ncbi:nicotinamide-nucleotide amidase [Breznakia sp. PF5-3]|uniref:CinA family protein n=1 Tax=unclassified Breznakia TaxID=2623764 RepID=UPI0024075387|nr:MULTISPECIES: CinA family protein [unclassified Breznakia]MDF9824622.1 nicotinamide-nucleotide amidase [Breznakia sp. PM6-1]MDF9835558.1 nicotinamide-nucleotide amidase [Breznakia sp. PF5-3]MDF9837940.1 nicotinamide-nucleotide amidase [Breznakia sp. PFB2-8]MDF9859929.1 nicotinamide-nucleotide amidase [Breznakia sp. PH5-24]